MIATHTGAARSEAAQEGAGSLALTLEVNLIFGVQAAPSPEQVQAISDQVAELLQRRAPNELGLNALHVESQVQATYLNPREGLATHHLVLPGPPGEGQLHLRWVSEQVIGQQMVAVLRSALREALFQDEPWVIARLEERGVARPVWTALRRCGVRGFSAELV